MPKRTKKLFVNSDFSPFGSAGKVKSMLDAGADVNTRFEEGVTPLMCACVHGNRGMVDVLLRAGADMELGQDGGGMTALMKAAFWGHADIVAKLIAAGAQVNKTTKYRGTALTHAAITKHADVVEALLQGGADVHLKDDEGKTALDIARHYGHAKVIALLEEAAAASPPARSKRRAPVAGKPPASKSRIMYIENKSGGLTGPARIGRVTFSKTGSTLYYAGKSFRSLKGAGFKSNYYEIESGDEYWISGCKKDGGDRLYGERVPIEIDEDTREEYWTTIRGLPKCKNRKCV